MPGRYDDLCSDPVFHSSRFVSSPETICVITSDGRVITGELVGHDQVQNLILNEAQERVYTDDAPVETVDLGLYVIRGDNVCMVGEFDPEKWDDSTVTPPLPPIQQHAL